MQSPIVTFFVDTNDDKYQNYQLNTTNDEKNYETKYSINPAKQSPSSAAQIDTAIFSFIAAVLIVSTKSPVFQVLKYLIIYHQFLLQGNHHLFMQ